MLTQAFNSIVQNLDSNTDPCRAIKKMVMKSLEERDYAAQETMRHLLSSKLHSSSFKVMPVSLNGSRRVRDTTEEGESCTDYSLLDVYANREQQFKQKMLYPEYSQHILLIPKAQILGFIVDINF